MIRIALAAALAAVVITDAAVLPASPGVTATNERPRALRGDRLPVRPTGAACADAAWPYYPAECVGGRGQPAGTPSARPVRIVAGDQTAVGRSPRIADENI